MSTAEDLVGRLIDPDRNGLDPAVLIPLLGLLAEGEPVEIGVLAAAAGLVEDDVRARLAAVPDTEYDEHGRVVGQGLTLRPTAHRFIIDGQQLYTWCALDTLIFPALIGKSARVESVSPAGGGPVQLTVSPSGVSEIEPTTAVVSLVSSDHRAIRSSFCNQVHFFTSAPEVTGWLAEHPDAIVLPVADAHRLGAQLVDALDRHHPGATFATDVAGTCTPVPTAAHGCRG